MSKLPLAFKRVVYQHGDMFELLPKAYIKYAVEAFERNIIAEEMVIPCEDTERITYDRGNRRLTINGVTHVIPQATDAPKKEILLTLLCEDFAGLGRGVANGRYRDAVQSEGYECSERMMETARVGLNAEIKVAFDIPSFIRSRSTSSVIPKSNS